MNSKPLLSKVFKIIGIGFTCLSIFILFPLTFFLASYLTDNYEKYDYDQINKNGIQKTAKVISVRTVGNVSINGKNPIIITYQFEDNHQKITDKCKTLDVENESGKIEPGNEINIKYYNKESVPIDIKPFSFPFNLFYLIPIIFFILGIVFGFLSYKIK